MIGTLLLVTILLLVVFFVVQWKKALPYRNWVGPKFHTLPFGEGPSRFLQPLKLIHALLDWEKKFHGKNYHYNMLGQQFVFLSDVETVKAISRDRNNFPNDNKFRKALTYRMGQSLFATEGELWKQKHKLLSPLLSNKMLQYNTVTVNRTCEKFIEQLRLLEKAEFKSYEVEIVNLLKRLTLDVIGEIAFGIEFDSLGHEKTFGGFKFSELADKALNGINARFLAPTIVWDLPLPVFNKEKEAVRILKGMFEGILQQTQEKMNSGEETFNLVSILLDAHNTPEGKLVYPHDQMLGECFSIWGAGHDTTTFTLAHTIKLLAKHQSAQEAARKELMALRDRLGGAKPNYNDFQGCKYTLACLKESQRLFPIAPLLLRMPTKDVVVNNLFFQKDTSVFINILAIQRSEEYYKNADKYLPERWLNVEEGEFDQFHFLTFGAGHRSCFGKKLAILEIVATLYYLLTQFVVEDDTKKHPHSFEYKFGMVPTDKKMIITVRRLE